MKKVLHIILMGVGILVATPAQAQDFFEGIVKYKLSYTPIKEGITVEALEKRVGTRITAMVKEDRYSLINNGKGEKGWQKITVRLDEGYKYTEFQKSDTIVKEKLGTEAHTLVALTHNKFPEKEFLGKQCESITIDYTIDNENSPFTNIQATYYFHPEYKLNPEFYTEDTDGFWNLFVKESGCMSLQDVLTIEGFMEASQTAESVEAKELPDALFDPAIMKVVIEK